MKFPPCSERNGELGDGKQAKKKHAALEGGPWAPNLP